MTCSVRRPLVRRTTEIAGTWDFKWPLGTAIRVAFQRPNLPSEHDFDQARHEVIRLAQRWEDQLAAVLAANPNRGITAGEFRQRGIRLTFPEELIFDAPDPSTTVLGDEHRSPFLTNDARRSQYDVLVSFADLPLTRRRSRVVRQPATKASLAAPSSGVEHVTAPTSELGAYARRFDFGLPTVYLGRFGTGGQAWLLHEYYKCPLVQHIVVHEFGHVLGLAHEHQNPKFPSRLYRSNGAIRDTFAKLFQLSPEQVTDDDVREQLIDEWPGAPEFSDWDDPRSSHRTPDDPQSVMAYPFHRLFLRPEPGRESDLEREIEAIRKKLAVLSKPPLADGHPDDPTLKDLLTYPTPLDIANLLRMYAPGCGCPESTDAAASNNPSLEPDAAQPQL